MENKIENQSVKKSKKAIISLICGIIAVFFPLLWILSEIMRGGFLWKIEDFLYKNAPLFLYTTYNLGLFLFISVAPGIFGITGLILGIITLKSDRKKMAVWGIVLCAIALLLWAYVDLVFYGMWSYYNQ